MCEHESCNVPAESGQELCILHLASPKDVEWFKEVLYQQIDETGPEEVRNSRFRFEGYCFPVGITIGEHSDREGSGVVILPSLIEGAAGFSVATIKGDADFRRATIEGDADFSGAMIKGDADFRRATVKGDADFRCAMIKGDADFWRATIKGDADLWGATIEGDADFWGATIEGDACFRGAAIKGDAKFHRVSAGSVHLGPGRPRIRGWKLSADRCGLNLADASHASSFWRFAQQAFSKNGEREAADAAFYFGRIWRWKELRRSEAAKRGSLRGLRTFVLRAGYSFLWLLDCLLLRWTTAYGASIARLFATWLVVIGWFGVVFSLVPRLVERPGDQVWTLRNWIIGFHYSVTTFATLGLGRIGPGQSRLGMVLTSIEALLGAVLIALAVLVLGRRFMRQG